jgi:hypothetical protein
VPRYAEPLDKREYGLLTVRCRGPNNNDGSARWWVDCRCGSAPKLVRGTALSHGQMKSCGCKRRARGAERTPRRAAAAMQDQEFGLLTCRVALPSLDGNQGLRWDCECRCGGWRIARAKDLRSGNTKSCGCLVGRPSARQGPEDGADRNPPPGTPQADET